KRFAPDLPVVLFVSQQGPNFTVLAYTNGTWFQMVGKQDGDSVRWSLTHGEPYLRRTFKGGTDEMRKVVEEAIAGKGKLPEPNADEKPGFGPEVEKPKEEKKEEEAKAQDLTPRPPSRSGKGKEEVRDLTPNPFPRREGEQKCLPSPLRGGEGGGV